MIANIINYIIELIFVFLAVDFFKIRCILYIVSQEYRLKIDVDFFKIRCIVKV